MHHPTPVLPLAPTDPWSSLLHWQGQARWQLLDTDFAQGQRLLQTWAAWQADAQRPQQLHYVAICAQPPSAAQVLAHAAPAHAQQARELADHLWGLLPGVHRIALHAEAVVLTLWIGTPNTLLRQQHMQADAVHLSMPEAHLWDSHSAKALARQCRHGSAVLASSASAALPPDLLAALHASGFALAPMASTTAQAPALQFGHYAPHWQTKPRAGAMPPISQPTQALVIGAGLAGAAAARSLAQRGWQVQVLAQGTEPADGASGLPAGLFCPHVSPDDSVLSRLTRQGVRMTLQRLQALCIEGQDWGHSGVLEHCTDGGTGLPAHWAHSAGRDWSHAADAALLQAAGLPPETASCWHAQAGWVRPGQWVRAQLRHPHIDFVPTCHVQQLQRTEDGLWQALDAHGQLLAQAALVVLACGPATAALLPPDSDWPLQPIRGQITWGLHTPSQGQALPPFPVNGHGNLVTHIPLPAGTSWVMGSTFERDVTALPVPLDEQATAHAANWDKLRSLLPASAAAMAPWFDPEQPECRSTWGQVRCASHDRLPIVGPVAADTPGLWAITALGARGLSLSVLCGELLATQLHGEPLPLDAKLAQHLGTERLHARQARSAHSPAHRNA